MSNTAVSGLAQPVILLIDGNCNLCHGITRFVIKRDSAKRFRFASIQSAAGQHLLARGGLPADDLDTFVMIQGGQYTIKSAAALRVFGLLDGLWPLLHGCIVIPAFIRDQIYNRIANRRYRLFGRREACLLPTAELQGRFLTTEEALEYGK